ncbi:MAG: SMC-Scp complex subunit ScpB [Candidatus Omnitrophota bacterium]
MENSTKIKSIIEALLVVSEFGLSREEMKNVIGGVDDRDVDEAVRLLKEEYESLGRSFGLAEIAGRYRIVTRPEYMPWIANLYQKEIDRLTGPSLETLAIVAYKQPATRSEIESIRGVNVGGVLKALLDKELIQIRGRKDIPGRPLVYGTTQKFLETFGLNSLHDLPLLRDFKEEDLEYGKPNENMIVETEHSGTEDTAEDNIQEQEQVSETDKDEGNVLDPVDRK